MRYQIYTTADSELFLGDVQASPSGCMDKWDDEGKVTGAKRYFLHQSLSSTSQIVNNSVNARTFTGKTPQVLLPTVAEIACMYYSLAEEHGPDF